MKRNKLLVGLLLSLVAELSMSRPLTPVGHPVNNSFYICYSQITISHLTRILNVSYQTLQYQGCMISPIPCHHRGKSGHTKQFSWKNNYPDALTDFYRCAYS